MAPRLSSSWILLAAILAVHVAAAAAKDCTICKNSVSTPSDTNANCYTSGLDQSTDSCTVLLASYYCDLCKPNGDATADGNCACKKTCEPVGGSGKNKVYCTCRPKSTTPGVCADPHFTGAYGIQYDFHGVPDKHFTLITDRDLNLNAEFIGQDGTETGFDGTWISALGIKWNEGALTRKLSIFLKDDADIRTSQDPFIVKLGDTEVLPPLVADVSDPLAIYDDAGLIIRRATDGRTYVFDIPHHMILGVTAADHEFPTGNHMDITLEKLNVTGTVHGALGQTFADARRAALKAAAAAVGTSERFDATDVVEGKDADYMTSALLASDARFNRFQLPGTGAEILKQNVLRKLLGRATAPTESLVPGLVRCASGPGGKLTCDF
ncbi:hypothetical protein KFL_001670060 [Klebsormidium nitens]|uniref:Root cap family protein n=1 Tax=Klebsormidium nitens TaxID=105231 RepID=A0A1Y1HZ25_KLENI|nr:hypothetical protein KFL_001670060 [Klebsormidium nitens]|eukprot:GAQ83895.1 hypothetical protein KFL_001670060 [Klebsormidium nitens]